MPLVDCVGVTRYVTFHYSTPKRGDIIEMPITALKKFWKPRNEINKILRSEVHVRVPPNSRKLRLCSTIYIRWFGVAMCPLISEFLQGSSSIWIWSLPWSASIFEALHTLRTPRWLEPRVRAIDDVFLIRIDAATSWRQRVSLAAFITSLQITEHTRSVPRNHEIGMGPEEHLLSKATM